MIKIMPEYYKYLLTYTMVMVQFFFIAPISTINADEGIGKYYIRYDVKSSKNRITNDNLLMVPAENDFRAEKFSRISTAGLISTTPGESKTSIEKRIRENSLKTILANKGLKSVKTKGYDTVISYEGIIIPPLIILKNTYHEDQNKHFYEVQIEFCPIAFPDKWKNLNIKHKIKQIFYDFFQLLK
ncbi:hypothetical protein SAMN04487931_101310 [Desulfobacula phenolica]|uniref:Uncharacterized protein n=2 Tax=Desulfobacula phenolica TaxID=90732 RepID=A0A1H2DPB9_9BACT|nr:hypothetical protein SAMN04487931_101310 [Desulfobacula phenolica]